MKINVTKKTLTHALDQLARVIPTRSPNPALTSVHIQPAPDGLRLQGTNLEVDLRVDVPAEVGLGEARPLLVPAHLLHAAVKKAAGAVIELEVQGSALLLRSGGGSSKIQLGDPELFAAMTFPEGGLPFDAGLLSKALSRTLYAVAEEAYQAVFRGLLLRLGAERSIAVASDGYRVATCALPGVPGLSPQQSMIIPGRSLAAVMPLLEQAKELTLQGGEGLLTLTTDQGAANIKLLDGDFPDWERVVPRAIVLTARLDRAALLEALDRAALFVDPHANHRVECILADGRLRLLAENDYGRAEEEVGAELSGSETALTCALNNKLFVEALKVLTGEVILEFSGSSSPLKIRCSGDDSLMGVLVTLRL